MYEVLDKIELADKMVGLEISAEIVAAKAEAGQFVIIRTNKEGERIPLTIADFDREEGSIKIVFQVVGKTTEELADMNPGDHLETFTGPLGKPTEVKNFGTVLIVGGGAGIAPTFPVARAMKEAGNEVISIIGARTEDLLFYEKEIGSVSNQLYIATDDGSKGKKGRVTDVLTDLIEEKKTIHRVFAVGPVPMMRAVVDITKKAGILTIVSLNPIMVDGTGMCGACRVTVGDETKFACVDGPDFKGHEVDFDELTARQNMYKKMESRSLEAYNKKHRGDCQCR